MRVLVVEDEMKLGALIARALAPEHDVVLVTNAKDALDLITAAEHFDLIMCDLMLPGISGARFHARVATIAPDLLDRIIFTTGGAYTLDAAAFLERADVRYIDKPFPSVDALRAAVREHIERLGGGGEGGAP